MKCYHGLTTMRYNKDHLTSHTMIGADAPPGSGGHGALTIFHGLLNCGPEFVVRQ